VVKVKAPGAFAGKHHQEPKFQDVEQNPPQDALELTAVGAALEQAVKFGGSLILAG
jgi:hypothetical protein